MAGAPERTVSSLDFDGDYGRNYRQSIQHSIPGYDVLHEIATAAVNVTSAKAGSVLVVGPGPGDELVTLLSSCADAEVTVIEPSAQMLAQCQRSINDHAGAERCRWIQSTLADAYKSCLQPSRFDLVVCHSVLHLVPAAEQVVMLQQLSEVTAVGGVLLLSSYSEADDAMTDARILAVGRQRLIDRGLSPSLVEQLLASRNRVVFSLDASRLSDLLSQQGWSQPVQLYQGLFARLWLCRAPG
jgi:tRNA (cmo5U34)-methyltransferase